MAAQAVGLKLRLGLALVWAATLTSATACAAQEVQPQPLDKVEIAGQAAGERSVVAGKLVLGRGLLARSNVATVREVLLRDPAVSVSANGRIGLMGLPGYTEVLLDGDPPPLGLNPLSLPPAQVERIEIVRGSSADTGLGAIAGTINVVRRSQRRALPLDWSAELGAPAYNQSARVSGQTVWKDADTGRSLSLAANGLRSRTVERSALQEWAGELGGAPAWRSTSLSQGHHDNLNLSLRTGFQLDKEETLQLSTDLLSADVGNSTHTLGMPDSNLGAALVRPSESISRWRWRTSPSFSQSLDWERPTEQGGVWALRAVLTRDHSLLETSGVARWGTEPEQALTNQERNRRTHASVRLVRRGWVLGDHKLQTGLEAQHERKRQHLTTADGLEASFIDRLFSPTATARSQDLGAWLQDDWPVNEDLSLKLGLRGVNRLNRLDEGAAQSKAQLRLLAPSLSVTWMPGEEGNHALTLSLSRGYKLPPAQRLNVRPRLDPTTPCQSREACGGSRPQAPDRAGNPALQPERSWGLDLTLESNVREHSAVSLGLAVRWIDQLIGDVTRLESVLWSTEQRWVTRPVNLGRARSHAVNVGVSLVPRDWWAEVPKSLELTGALNWAGSTVSTVPGPYNRLPDQTPFSARLSAKYVAQGMPLEWRIDGLLHPSNWWQDAAGMLRHVSVKRAWSLSGTWSFSLKQQLALKASSLPGQTLRTDSYWPSDGLRTLEESRMRPEISIFWSSRQ
mgnify:CR=1 FL=1